MKNNRNVFLSYFTRMSSREKHALEQQSLKDPFFQMPWMDSRKILPLCIP